MANLARNGPRPRRGRFMGSGSHSFASHTRATSLAPGGSHSNVISKVSLTLRLFLVIIHPSVFAASQLCTPVLPGGYKGRQASGSTGTDSDLSAITERGCFGWQRPHHPLSSSSRALDALGRRGGGRPSFGSGHPPSRNHLNFT